MSKVNITKANLNLIVRSLRKAKQSISKDEMLSAIVQDFAVEDLFNMDDLNELYNMNELKDLYNTKMVLMNFESLIKSIETDKENISSYVLAENKRYVYEVKAPAYHYSNECKWMKSTFDNVEVPKECISSVHTEEVIRKWLSENKHQPFEQLNQSFKDKFDCSKGLSQVSFANSGTVIVDNIKVELELGQNVKLKKKQLRFLLDGELGKKIANYRYANASSVQSIVRNEKNRDAHQPIVEFHEAKKELKSMIIDLFKKKYNFDLSFDDHILDMAGFRACKGCKNHDCTLDHAA